MFAHEAHFYFENCIKSKGYIWWREVLRSQKLVFFGHIKPNNLHFNSFINCFACVLQKEVLTMFLVPAQTDLNPLLMSPAANMAFTLKGWTTAGWYSSHLHNTKHKAISRPAQTPSTFLQTLVSHVSSLLSDWPARVSPVILSSSHTFFLYVDILWIWSTPEQRERGLIYH